MTVQEMFDQLKKIIDAGNGDAEMYICDTRSGIDEEFAREQLPENPKRKMDV